MNEEVSAAVLRKRFRRRVRQREKRHHARRGQRRWPAARSSSPPNFVRLMAPAEIGVRAQRRNPTLRFCRDIREHLLRERVDLVLDFSRTVEIAPAGMLLIYAELDRALRMSSDRTISCKLPESGTEKATIVCQVLDQIGLLARIGQRPPNLRGDDEHHETVRHWRYATGTRIDERPGDVLEEHEGRITPALMERVQIGLAEALANIMHHAYLRPRDDGCRIYPERRWWMFTREMNGRLDVVVCDLGIGIPKSLPLKWDKRFLAKVAQIFGNCTPDEAAIQTALILGESSTGDEHRGKGLPQIWNAVRESPGGEVGIWSEKAYVGHNPTDGEWSTSYSTPVQGTLVSWSLSISPPVVVDG